MTVNTALDVGTGYLLFNEDETRPNFYLLNVRTVVKKCSIKIAVDRSMFLNNQTFRYCLQR